MPPYALRHPRHVCCFTPVWRAASAIELLCPCSTATCRSFSTISPGLSRFPGIFFPLRIRARLSRLVDHFGESTQAPVAAGCNLPVHSPKPIRYPLPCAWPRSVIVSPSSTNERLPPSISTGSLPPHESSRSEPRLSSLAPEIVPERLAKQVSKKSLPKLELPTELNGNRDAFESFRRLNNVMAAYKLTQDLAELLL